MFGCKDVIPEKFQDVDKAWIGTDNASALMRFKKRIQYWLAIGPLGNHWYCKTRFLPKTLFVKYGGGPLRYENSNGKMTSRVPKSTMYLSRIQCWARWHVAVQWPLFFQAHLVYKQKNVPAYPEYRSDFGIDKMINIQFGFKRDGDEWHILTAFFGGNHE